MHSDRPRESQIYKQSNSLAPCMCLTSLDTSVCAREHDIELKHNVTLLVDLESPHPSTYAGDSSDYDIN